MDQQDKGKSDARGKVIDLRLYRGRARKKREASWDQARAEAFAQSVDGATRDLHAAANLTMKMVFLARDQMGLPPL